MYSQMELQLFIGICVSRRALCVVGGLDYGKLRVLSCSWSRFKPTAFIQKVYRLFVRICAQKLELLQMS